jgi:type IV pilus assembly protein PilW
MGSASMFHTLTNKRGFTLTELLVAMALSGVVMASIGYLYYTQQKSYLVQENLAAAQQNIRSAMYFMEREIRMAGYDPESEEFAGITIANVAELEFTKDDNGSGGNNFPGDEQIRYALTNDADEDGIADGTPCNIGRETGGAGGLQSIAENIDALNFVYLDSNSNPTADTDEIRTIQVTIVARTGRADQGYTDTKAYYNQQDKVNPILPAQNDHFRRKQLDVTIRLRNPKE